MFSVDGNTLYSSSGTGDYVWNWTTAAGPVAYLSPRSTKYYDRLDYSNLLYAENSMYTVGQFNDVTGGITILAGNGGNFNYDGIGTNAYFSTFSGIAVWRCALPGMGVNTNFNLCERCPAGKFSNSMGFCGSCPAGTTSPAASSTCLLPVGYYLLNGATTPCPAGYFCLGGTATLQACPICSAG